MALQLKADKIARDLDKDGIHDAGLMMEGIGVIKPQVFIYDPRLLRPPLIMVIVGIKKPKQHNGSVIYYGSNRIYVPEVLYGHPCLE